MDRKLVYYSQEDPRWKNILFSNHQDPKQTIGASGCGPTCFAMVASSLLTKQVLPPEAAQYAIDKGYRTYDNGTAWGFYANAAKSYGLLCKQTVRLDDAIHAITEGSIVICSIRNGHFTSGGHYIVLVAVDGDWIEVYDPNHDNKRYGISNLIKQGIKDDGKVMARKSVFIKEAAQYWIFSKEEEGPMLTVKDADKIIALLGAVWQVVDTPEATNAGQVEAARLANEMRKASGQPTK